MATLSSQLILTLRDRVTGPARGVGRALDRLQRDAQGFGAQQAALAGGVGRSIRNLALLGAGYIGVGAGVGSAVRSAMDWQSALADIEKTSGLSGAALARMGDTLTDLSSRMPITRTDLAGLVAQAATFGVAAEHLDEFAVTAARASVAFDMTAEDTAQNLSTMMNAFGLGVQQLEELTDQINFTADKVGGTESDLMDFLARTGPTAVGFGIEPETLLAYGGALMGLGISAERGATGMNAVMSKMSALTDNAGAVELLDRLGGRGFSARLQRQFYERPVDAINELFHLSKSMSAEERAGFFLQFFGAEYSDDAAAIVSALDTIMEAQGDLADSTRYLGGVQSAYDIFAGTAANRLRVLGNNLTNISAAMGAKLLGPIVSFSDLLVETLGTLDERVSVFDRVGAALDGLFTGIGEGLGLEGGDLGRLLSGGWTALFGDPATFEADVDRLTRVFMDMREWGVSLGEAAAQVGEFFARVWDGVEAIEAFLGAEPGTAAELLQTLATGGLALAGVGAILATAGRGVGVLARGLFYLSGASMLLGGARGIAALFGAIAGGQALAGAELPDRGGRRRGGRGGALVPLGIAAGVAVLAGGGAGRTDSEATQSRIASARATARGEALRAQTLTTVAPRRESFWEMQAFREETEATSEAAGTLGETLQEIGSTPVRPEIDTSDLERAATLSARLRGNLGALGGTMYHPGGAAIPVTGARASGGPVGPGTWLVGEEGPELVRFGDRGHVFDAHDTRALLGGRSSRSAAPLTVNLGGITVNGAPSMDARELARFVMEEAGRQFGTLARSQYSDAI